MTHLEDESIEDLKESVSKTIAVVEDPKAAAKEDARDQEQWPFHFEWTDMRGKVWKGNFVNRILSIGDQQRVAILKSRFIGGQPVESMDAGTLMINGAIAHMTFSLEKTPDWARDLRKLNDIALVMKIFEKVESHEAYFFRLEAAQTESSSSG